MTSNIIRFFTGQKPQESEEAVATQLMFNLRDIRGQFCYTHDGYVFCYIKMEPVSIDLFSKTELKTTTNILTSEFSREDEGFGFHALDQSLDIKPTMTFYSGMKDKTTNAIRKKLLLGAMTELSEMAHGGNITQKMYYWSLWSKFKPEVEGELQKRVNEFLKHLEAGKYRFHVLTDGEILNLFMQYNNPSMSHLEMSNYDSVKPYVSDEAGEDHSYE